MRGISIIVIVLLMLEIVKENARSFLKYQETYQINDEAMMSFYIDSLKWVVEIIEIKEFSTHVCMVLLTVYFIYGTYSKYKYLVQKKVIFNQSIKLLLDENKNKKSLKKLYEKVFEFKSEIKTKSIANVLFSITILSTLFITDMIKDNWFGIVLTISILFSIHMSYYAYNFSRYSLNYIKDLILETDVNRDMILK